VLLAARGRSRLAAPDTLRLTAPAPSRRDPCSAEASAAARGSGTLAPREGMATGTSSGTESSWPRCPAPPQQFCSACEELRGVCRAGGAGHSPAQRGTAGLGTSSWRRSGKENVVLTRERSFPVAIAMADSKHPVVEKVQQLPQGPCVRNRGGLLHDVPQGHQPPQNPRAAAGGHARSAALPLPAGSWALPSARPLPSCPGHPRPSHGGAPGGARTPQPSSSRHRALPAAVSPSWCVANDMRSSPGFSRVSRNSPSSSSRWSRDAARSCAGSSPLWPSSSASEVGGLRRAAVPGGTVAHGQLPSPGRGSGDRHAACAAPAPRTPAPGRQPRQQCPSC